MGAADRPPRRDRQSRRAGQALEVRDAGRSRQRRPPRRVALTVTAGQPLLPFVQLDLPGRLGLPAGRYLAREGDRERVLIVQELGAPAPRAGLRRRRPREVEPEAPAEVPLTRVTVTGAAAFGDPAEASAWLSSVCGDAERRTAEVRSATTLVNRALNALRAASRDPLVQDVGATRALTIRIGVGVGAQLAEGRWSEARELPPPRRGRLDDVDPQTRVAAVLAGRETIHPAETLLLRGWLDLEQGRRAEALAQARAAAAALEADPGETARESLRRRISELEERARD